MNRPIVAFAHHPWVEPEWMNRQQILSRLGQRGWPVAYSCGPLDVWQRHSARWQNSPWFDTFVERDHARDIQAGKLGARWRRFPIFDRFAIARHARFIRSTVAGRDERIIAMLFDPQFYPYVEHLEPCDVVFHAYDSYAGQAGWDDGKALFQAALVTHANLITASSEAIARYLGDPRVRVLPNGADVDAFTDAGNLAEPPDLKALPRPRLGYVGAINRKVDLKLIADVASDRPEWQWVLVGRMERAELVSDPNLTEHFARCEVLPNVHFVGQKNRLEVPAYVGHMDINTMCYRVDGNGWWKAIYPLKLHEYLAVGLPVISTPVESVLPFKDVVKIAKNANEWIEGVSCYLASENAQQRQMQIATARANSWDSRVSQLEQWLHEATAGDSGS